MKCVSSLGSSAMIHSHPYYIYRIFRAILKTDRETYGVGEDYVIADLVADDWQQRVDDVVSGI